MTRIFQWFFMWKMDPMSDFDTRLVFTLPLRDSTLQYKRCVHLWNNFPCIITTGVHIIQFLIESTFRGIKMHFLCHCELWQVFSCATLQKCVLVNTNSKYKEDDFTDSDAVACFKTYESFSTHLPPSPFRPLPPHYTPPGPSVRLNHLRWSQLCLREQPWLLHDDDTDT